MKETKSSLTRRGDLLLIGFQTRGELRRSTAYLQRLLNLSKLEILNRYGEIGVAALQNATPVDTGRTADSWYFTTEIGPGSSKLIFHNSNINKGVPIAIILQYGHCTGTGGYVEGVDYINPALAPVFEQLSDELWKEVTKVV